MTARYLHESAGPDAEQRARNAEAARVRLERAVGHAKQAVAATLPAASRVKQPDLFGGDDGK